MYNYKLRNKSQYILYLTQYFNNLYIHYKIKIKKGWLSGFDAKFNCVKLFNVGYREITMCSPAGCFNFHDVNLMPENINNIYGCTNCPRHLSTSINVFNYKFPYYNIFGGAFGVTRRQFHDINEFSNIFYGWTSEDDDFV